MIWIWLLVKVLWLAVEIEVEESGEFVVFGTSPLVPAELAEANEKFALSSEGLVVEVAKKLAGLVKLVVASSSTAHCPLLAPNPYLVQS